jgi:hypothetical protein
LLIRSGSENLDGKKVILHKLDPKDNYYSIARRYSVKPADIIKFNNNAPLKIGVIIKVPTDRSFVETTKPVIAKKQADTAPACLLLLLHRNSNLLSRQQIPVVRLKLIKFRQVKRFML